MLQDTERLRIERTEDEVSLTITKVMKADDGEYQCRLVNPAGEASCFARLFAQYHVIE